MNLVVYMPFTWYPVLSISTPPWQLYWRSTTSWWMRLYTILTLCRIWSIPFNHYHWIIAINHWSSRGSPHLQFWANQCDFAIFCFYDCLLAYLEHRHHIRLGLRNGHRQWLWLRSWRPMACRASQLLEVLSAEMLFLFWLAPSFRNSCLKRRNSLWWLTVCV